MELSEVLENLCCQDSRNPNFIKKNITKGECCCNNCVNGRDKLADSLIDAMSEIDNLTNELRDVRDELDDANSSYESAEYELNENEERLDYLESRLAKADEQYDLIGFILNQR